MGFGELYVRNGFGGVWVTGELQMSTGEKILKSKKSNPFFRWLPKLANGSLWVLAVCFAVLTGYVVVTNHRGEGARRQLLSHLDNVGVSTADPSAWMPAKKRAKIRLYLLAGAAPVQQQDLPIELSAVMDLPQGKALESGDWCAKVERYIEANSAYLALLDKVSSSKSLGISLLSFGNKSVCDMGRVQDGLRQAFRTQRLLCFRSVCRGDDEQAVKSCNDMLRLSSLLSTQAPFGVWLTRSSLGSYLLDSFQYLLSQMEPDSRLLEKSCNLLRNEAKAISLEAQCLAELQLARRWLENFDLWFLRVANESKRYYEDMDEPVPRWVAEDLTLVPSMKLRESLRWFRGWSAICPGSYKLRVAGKVRKLLQVQQDAKKLSEAALAGRCRNMLAQEADLDVGYAGLLRSIIEISQYRAELRVIRAGLLAEIYRREYGRWPEDLGSLKKSGLQDPFCESSLKYEITEKGRVIYSVGRNGKDDGGRYGGLSGANDDVSIRLIDVQLRNTGTRGAK
ncbi:MAG: hypothetical protein ACLFWL_12330 [Candidatus Brocadiia bacterium]